VEFEIGKGLKHEFKYVVKGFYFISESIHKLKFNIELMNIIYFNGQ